MSRPLRIEYSGAWYHLMNRGRRGDIIFAVQEDREIFLSLLQEAATLWKVNIAAYCLMDNHYHNVQVNGDQVQIGFGLRGDGKRVDGQGHSQFTHPLF